VSREEFSITTDYTNASYNWSFDNTGTLTAPGDITTTGNVTAGNLDAVNLVINRISSDDSSFVTVEDGVNVNGDIAATGNITGNYFIGDGSQLTGISSITTVELAGEPLVINNVAGANTIYVKSASGYTGSDTHTINVLNRNVDGLRTLIVNNSALCNVIVGFADGVSITVAATDRVDVVYIDNTIIVISQFLLDLQTAYS